MVFLNISPTDIMNSTFPSTSVINSFGNSPSTPETISNKRKKTNMSYPEDIINQLKPCDPPRQSIFALNSMGWDCRNTLWDTTRSW